MTNKQRALDFERIFREIFHFENRPIGKPFDADAIESGHLYEAIKHAFNKLEVKQEDIIPFCNEYECFQGKPLREIPCIEKLMQDFEAIVEQYK